MIPPVQAHILISLIVGISILLMLVRPRNISESYWIVGGVLLLLALRLVPLPLTARAVVKASDVCLFLIGMMLLSELAREHGVFDWLSAAAVRQAGGSCSSLFAMVYGLGALVTIFMSNDATAVVLTPAILAAVRKSKVKPLPYLFVCAFIANAASFILPISNPANLVVFHDGVPPLGKWLLSFGIPCLLSIASTFIVLRFLFRDELREKIECEIEPVPLRADGKLVLVGLFAMVIVLLAASSLGKDLGWPTCLAAGVVTAVVSIRARCSPMGLIREISWGTLALVAGLFVMVDAMENVGAMNFTRQWLIWAQTSGQVTGSLVTGFVVGIANNFVNNLPLGLIAGSTVQAAHTQGLITNAVLVGVDLGPNLSVTGSLATILWLIALRKENVNVTFWDFLKVGVFAMPVALLVSLAGAIVLHAFFGLS